MKRTSLPHITPAPHPQANHPLRARDDAPVILTTVFTAPASCESLSRRYFSTQCLPSSRGSNFFQTGYFSPAICPSGWKPACARPTTLYSESIPYGPPILPSEIATICCPNAMTCSEGLEIYCAGGPSGEQGIALQIRWQSSDLKFLETLPLDSGSINSNWVSYITPTASRIISSINSATNKNVGSTISGTGSTGLATTASTSPATNESSPVSDQSRHGLSTGAKIGIAVPVALISIAVLVAMWIWIRRRRARNQLPVAAVSDLPEVNWKPEYQERDLPTKDEVSRTYTQELGSNGVVPGATSQRYNAPSLQPRVYEAAGQTQYANEMTGSSATRGFLNELGSPQSNSASEYPANVRMETQQPILPVQLQREIVEEPSNDPEIQRLQEQRLRLQEKKARLKQLQDLDDEEESLRVEVERRLKEMNPSPPPVEKE